MSTNTSVYIKNASLDDIVSVDKTRYQELIAAEAKLKKIVTLRDNEIFPTMRDHIAEWLNRIMDILKE